MNDSLLRAESISFRYPRAPRAAVERVSLALRAGETLAVAGPNGCGKSTLLSLLAGFRKPAEGHVALLGRDLGTISPREAARMLAVLPQMEVAQPRLTAMQMVLLGRLPHLRGPLAFESAEDLRIARESLEAVGMESFAERRLGTLSGGERQLVLAARALAQRPRVLLLDEPTASLDLGHQQRLLRVLRRLAEERSLAVLFVTHDLNLAARFADRIMLLRDGRTHAEGAPAEVLREEVLGPLYDAELSVRGGDMPAVLLRR